MRSFVTAPQRPNFEVMPFAGFAFCSGTQPREHHSQSRSALNFTKGQLTVGNCWCHVRPHEEQPVISCANTSLLSQACSDLIRTACCFTNFQLLQIYRIHLACLTQAPKVLYSTVLLMQAFKAKAGPGRNWLKAVVFPLDWCRLNICFGAYLLSLRRH